MIYRYLYFVILVFSLSCESRNDSKELVNAKWFYYAYAADLNGYDVTDSKVNPLVCEAKVKSIIYSSKDTARYYFALYLKDTLNEISLKPLGLVGIRVIRNNLFTPIYHMVRFNEEPDTLVMREMSRVNSGLVGIGLSNDRIVNPWIRSEAERRKQNDSKTK